jgi:hypothetical protein
MTGPPPVRCFASTCTPAPTSLSLNVDVLAVAVSVLVTVAVVVTPARSWAVKFGCTVALG